MVAIWVYVNRFDLGHGAEHGSIHTGAGYGFPRVPYILTCLPQRLKIENLRAAVVVS